MKGPRCRGCGGELGDYAGALYVPLRGAPAGMWEEHSLCERCVAWLLLSLRRGL